MSEIEHARLLKEAKLLLNKIEKTINFIVDDIQSKQYKKLLNS